MTFFCFASFCTPPALLSSPAQPIWLCLHLYFCFDFAIDSRVISNNLQSIKLKKQNNKVGNADEKSIPFTLNLQRLALYSPSLWAYLMNKIGNGGRRGGQIAMGAHVNDLKACMLYVLLQMDFKNSCAHSCRKV